MLKSLRRIAPALAAGLGLVACGGTMEMRSLATGHADVAAYELTGADPAALRREAQRLCPTGGEILRSSSQDQPHEVVGGRIRGWLNAAASQLDPPRRAAQLMLLCRSVDGAGSWQALATTGAAAAPAGIAAAARPGSATSTDPAAPGPAKTPAAASSPPAVPDATATAAAAALPARAIAASRPAAAAAPALPIGPISAQW